MKGYDLARKTGWALMIALLVVGCGAYKRRAANNTIKSVREKGLQEMTAAGAQAYAPDAFQAFQGQLREAEDLVQAEKYDEAQQKAQQAEVTASQTVLEAQRRKAEIVRSRSETERILSDAETLLEKARGAPGGEAAYPRIGQAADGVAALRSKMAELKGRPQQAQEEYAQLVTDASSALHVCRGVYDLTLEDQTRALEEQLAELREEAESLEPELYMPERTQQVRAQYEQFDLYFDAGSYEQAYELAKALSAGLPGFIAEVREERAGKTLADVEQARNAARAGDVHLYAREEMMACSAGIVEASKAFSLGEFDRSYQAGLGAEERLEAAYARMENKANDIIDQVDREIATARSEGAQEFASEALKEAVRLFSEASLSLGEQKFRECLEVGDQALVQAGVAITLSKKRKAEDVARRTRKLIETSVGQGADEYATLELADALESLSEAERELEDGNFARVHTLAAYAEQKAKQVITVLRNRAQDTISAAEAAQQDARESKAQELAPEPLKESGTLLAVSRVNLGNGLYRDSIERAATARDLARRAESAAYRIRSDEIISKARLERDEARNANAPEYAGDEFNSSLEALRRAEEFYNRGSYKEALASAESSFASAQEARTKKLNSAATAVERARVALAEMHAPQAFAEALAYLSDAKQAMEQKEYASSHSNAERARKTASAAEYESWKTRYQDQAAKVEEMIDNLVRNMGEEKVPDHLGRCRTVFAEARAAAVVEEYESAFRKAEEAGTAVAAAETVLGEVAAGARNDLFTRSQELADLAEDPFGRGEHAKLFAVLTDVDSALAGKMFGEVFEGVTAGLELSEDLQRAICAHNVEHRITAMEERLASYQDSGRAAVLPAEFESLNADIKSAKVVTAAQQYEDALETVGFLEGEVEAFPQDADRALDRILLRCRQTLTEARQAGAMEYVRGEFVEAQRVYKDVLSLPRDKDYHELAGQVHDASRMAAAVLNHTLVSIDERHYKDVVRSYMLELNSLIDQWPFSSRPKAGKIESGILTASRSTREVDVYHELQRYMSDEEFKKSTADLYRTISQVEPPPTLKLLHADALDAFRILAEAADLFNRFGMYSLYSTAQRENFLRSAYAKLEELEDYNIAIAARMEGLEPPKESWMPWSKDWKDDWFRGLFWGPSYVH